MAHEDNPAIKDIQARRILSQTDGCTPNLDIDRRPLLVVSSLKDSIARKAGSHRGSVRLGSEAEVSGHMATQAANAQNRCSPMR